MLGLHFLMFLIVTQSSKLITSEPPSPGRKRILGWVNFQREKWVSFQRELTTERVVTISLAGTGL
jgi:hypothetical protein